VAPPARPDEEAFRTLLVTDPGDLTTLLVFADWLDERSDPRGPAIRAEAAARCMLPPRDVHGILEADRLFGAAYTPAELEALGTLPWPPDVLAASVGSHILVAGCPLSIMDLDARQPTSFWGSDTGHWYRREPFARAATVEARWHLLRKAALPSSPCGTFSQQTALLPQQESVPRACEVSYAAILHHLSAAETLFRGADVRCADTTSHGARVLVSCFAPGKCYIGPEWHDHKSRSRGLAAARRV
jgi:uncharacterized protein (TIGR02996 family)